MKQQILEYWDSWFNRDPYLTYKAGNMPLIISAPHGGNMKPVSIPKRTYGVLERDSYSKALAESVLSRFYDKPYYIIANIHRNRVDLNRGVKEAAQGNYKATRIWDEWNEVITSYRNKILYTKSRALYVDIHSQGHDEYFHLGYNVDAKDYVDLYKGRINRLASSLDALGTNTRELMFGEFSIKNLIESRGFKCKMPVGDEGYYNGGRNITEYNGNGLAAIQIECPISVLKNNQNLVANAVHHAIQYFHAHHVETEWHDRDILWG